MVLTGPPAGAVRQARRLAESLMVEHCRVVRYGEMTVGDDGFERPSETVVYEGRCKVQSFESYEVTPTAGEHRFTTQRYQVHVPVSVEPLNVNDVIHVDGYEYPFLVTNDFQKTYSTASRYFVTKMVD